MVSVTLFGIGVLALTAAGTVSLRNIQAGKSYQAASLVASGKLDSLRALGWTALAGESGSDTVLGYPMAWEVSGENPRIVQLKVILGQVSEGTKESLDLNTIQVSPIDADIQYKTLSSEAGVDIHVTLVSR
jgi:hypothetical protein